MLAFRFVAELVNGISEKIGSISAIIIQGKIYCCYTQERTTYIATVIKKGTSLPYIKNIAGAAVLDKINLLTIEGLLAAR